MSRMPDPSPPARRALRSGRRARGVFVLVLALVATLGATVGARDLYAPLREMIAAAEEVAEVDPALARAPGTRLGVIPGAGDRTGESASLLREAAREAVQIELDRELERARSISIPAAQSGSDGARGASDKARGEAMRAQGAARGSSIAQERRMKHKEDAKVKELVGGPR